MGRDSHELTAADHEYKQDMDDYLGDLQQSNVKTLQELVDWNLEHAEDALPAGTQSQHMHRLQTNDTDSELEYPSQEQLTNSLNMNMSSDKVQSLRDHYTEVGASMDAMLDKYDIDIILAPGDCFMTQYASAKGSQSLFIRSTLPQLIMLGCPIISLPLTTLDFNGRPIGIQAISSAHKESLLIKFMSAYASAFPPRPVPEAFKAEFKSTENISSKVWGTIQ